MFSLWFCHDATIVFVCLLLLQLCVGVSCLVSGFVMMRLWCLFVVTPIVCWCFMFSLWFCHNATIVFVCLLYSLCVLVFHV